ncbi:MAG TPA: SpoIIE family protein phosphatase [Terracidiphilus sp.]|nr:SpoIIE family protein phosphatase [Terracidiphilus sp.]
MRKPALLLVFLSPLAAFGQGIVSIAPQQCVWRAGDNPAWAAPNLDENGWQPYTQWKLNPDEPHMWVRCHADLSSLRGAAHPAIQVTLYAAYRLYVNGEQTGGAGNLRSGQFSMDAIRSFPLPPPFAQPAAIALRITHRLANPPAFSGAMPPLALDAGDESLLRGRRAGVVLAQSANNLTDSICYGIVGVFGTVLLGLFVYDRGRREVLLLSLACYGLLAINLAFACADALMGYSSAAYLALYGAGVITVAATRVWFFFALARRRVPLLFWILIGLSTPVGAIFAVEAFLPAAQALWIGAFFTRWALLIGFSAWMLAETAPFVAFWPYARIPRRMRALAGLCMAWGTAMVLFFAVRLTALHIPGVPNVDLQWNTLTSEAEVITTLCVVAALLGLLFREQQQVVRERAELAGEMHAASEIQRMLAPAEIESAPGLLINVAFCPVRDVGGDFYLCRMLPGGRQRVLVGDVSGKGAAAAMAATLLLGASAARDSDSPSTLLAHLNRVFSENRLSGFATCLCADVAPNGDLVIANAGHLAPYRNGAEIPVDNGLPLGILPDSRHLEATCRLAPGDRLTFISDGVVEAQSSTGELFGFARTCAISNQSAEQIAAAAQAHGQEDDITVLTLTFAPAEVLHA